MENKVKVDVKWMKDIFKDIEIDFDQKPDIFKAKLFSLTNVPPENQKIMFRSGPLKDDWAPLKGKIKSGQQVMLMGTASDKLPPQKVPIYVDEQKDDMQLESNQAYYPPGIENLGNTCYMNASIQCLNGISELKQCLTNFDALQSDDLETNITRSIKNLFHQLSKNNDAVIPLEFLKLFRSGFPQFAEMKNGKYVQQDAEECWTQLLNSLRRLPRLPDSNHIRGNNAIEQLFEIGIKEEYTCIENPDELKTSNFVNMNKLQCHIQGGKTPTTQMLEGIELSMHEQLEKNSPTLGKSCLYQKDSSINRLPYYLTVQFVRFFWKKTKEKKTKITRTVDIPMTLDLYKYCSSELQERILPNRITAEEKEKGVIISQGIKPEVVPINPGPYVNSTGIYELYGIVTHQGIYADGGHYVAWVRQSSDPNDWLEFDDKEVTPKKEDDIKRLNGSGGAQWHIAYLCLYKSKS